MPCSPAQLEANRRNAAHSTGPRTPEGKAVSRRNGLKHGLTGEGIVLPNEDAEELEKRIETLEAEMRPTSELARHLVARMALMMIRLGRSALHEAKETSHRMRNAIELFDRARLAEVDHLISWIAAEPATNARQLRKTPEGLERLIAAVDALRSDLAKPGSYEWDYIHSERLHNLLGLRSTDLPTTRICALTEAIEGRFHHLNDEADGAGLEFKERRVWAIGELVHLMDAELVDLKAKLEASDREGLELDRAEAPARAMFDDSKESVLARKYEATSERAFFRALREFQELEAESEAEPRVAEELGSSLAEVDPAENESADIDSTFAETLSPGAYQPERVEKRSRPRLDGRGRKVRRSKSRR